MTDEDDPEVLADLQLRRSSETDRTRTRSANYDWAAPAVEARWKCFSPHCANFVDVPDGTEEIARTMDERLASLGEDPLDRSKILRCDSCRQKLADARLDGLDKRVAKERDLVRELKSADRPPSPEREREIFEQLERWHHPDLEGLKRVLGERRRVATGKRREL